jgi:RimJ/RimL family protein N-acetyltransferase
MMTEALPLVVEASFRNQDILRIEALCHVNNHVSRMVLVRGGFRFQGVIPKALKLTNGWEDHERWTLSKEDWLSSMNSV